MAQWKESRLWDTLTRIKSQPGVSDSTFLNLSFLSYEVMKWKITESLALNLAQNKTSLSSKRVLAATSVSGPPEAGARDTGDQGDKTDKPASVD